jgi:hypothetical protein
MHSGLRFKCLGPKRLAKDAPVAQLDRAPDYESGGQEFESLRARQFVVAKASPAYAPSGRAAAPPAKNIENNPMQSSRAVAGTDALSRCLTRRANQLHGFIIAKSVRRPRARNGGLFGVTSGEATSPMIGRCIVTASMHRCDPIPRMYVEDERPTESKVAIG